MKINVDKKQTTEIEIEVPFYSKKFGRTFYWVTEEGVTIVKEDWLGLSIEFRKANENYNGLFDQQVGFANEGERITEDEFVQAFQDLNLRLSANLLQAF